MKLTTAGRIALFANLALSLLFAFWGFGIYSQRSNWTDKKLGEREGEYAKRDAEIKRLKTSLDRVETRWANTSRGVVALEEVRPKEQEWYRQQIERLKTGDANQKILGIDFDAQGRIRFDPKNTGYPAMTVITDHSKKPIPGLASLQVLNDAYTRIQKDIVKVTEEIEQLVQQEKGLTEQVGDGKVRGLLFDLAQQQLAEKRSLDEQEYLQPLLYNSMVKLQSLESRQKVLEERLKKLQTLSLAKQP
jgi:hypothetical protein